MTKRYSIAEARAELPKIIDAVEAGADVEITRRGDLVAVVTAPERLRGSARPSFAEAYRAFLASHPNRSDGLPASFAAKLRDRSPGRKVRL